MSEAMRAIAIAASGFALALFWFVSIAVRTPRDSPARLVHELRLAQFAALVLTFTAAVYLGFAVSHEHRPGIAVDVALASGYLVVSAVVLTLDPRRALGVLALAFLSHAVLDVLHRPGLLPEDVVPRWYIIACAVYDVLIGACCYLPLIGRGTS
jgi:hypothetical protein